jgi:LEA14-like dessication related protein
MRQPRQLLALLIPILIFIGGCAQLDEIVQEPQLHFKKVVPADFSLAGARFHFDFDVYNPNPLGLRLSQVTYNLALNRHPLASGKLTEGIALPARGSAPLTIPLRLDFEDLLAAVGDMGNGPKLPYRLNGDIFVGPLAIPYDVKGDLELPRLPKVELAGVEIRELSLSGARLACRVRLTNRNAIPLDLGRLAYRLQLGEIQVAGGETAPLAPLAASGSDILSLDTRIRFREVGMGLLKLLQGAAAAYTLSGSFSQPLPGGGHHQTPFSFSGEAPLKR